MREDTHSGGSGEAHSGGSGYTPTDGTGVTVPSNAAHITVPSSNSDMTTPPIYPTRKYLAHPPVVDSFNRSCIVFLTVCTKDKTPVLACDHMHRWLLHAWSLSGNWVVGRYMIMPDHIHLFCAPGTFPPTSIKKWASYWKGLISRATKGHGPLACPGGSGCAHSGGSGYTPTDGTGVTVPSSNAGAGGTAPSNIIWPDTLWQNDCWDTQLRHGESYTAKWEYVRNNPVRAGLCTSTEAWLFQGEVASLAWHD
jgi:REP element-mobilizing transposase RayT